MGAPQPIDENATKRAVMQAINGVKGDSELKDNLINNINAVMNPFNNEKRRERMKSIQKNINQYGINLLDFDEALVNGLIDKIIVKENKRIVVHFKSVISRKVLVS